MSATGFPLAWPPGFPRSRSREAGKFRTTLDAALKNVQTSLSLFGRDSGKPVTDVVMSSNVTLGTNKPADPGVAVYFTWEQIQVCIPVDRYSSVEANLQAIHHVIEARRVELRHGTLALVRATFQGFKLLEAPRSWRAVLEVDPAAAVDAAAIERRYRALAKTRHPDQGGSVAAMAELNLARDAAKRELGA